jgi:hypothetical protein
MSQLMTDIKQSQHGLSTLLLRLPERERDILQCVMMEEMHQLVTAYLYLVVERIVDPTRVNATIPVSVEGRRAAAAMKELYVSAAVGEV